MRNDLDRVRAAARQRTSNGRRRSLRRRIAYTLTSKPAHRCPSLRHWPLRDSPAGQEQARADPRACPARKGSAPAAGYRTPSGTYLAVDPANRLVAETLEADWNTALRALNDAQATYDKTRQQHPGQLTEEQKTRIRRLVTDLPGIWNDPWGAPMRERKRITRLLLTDVTVTRTSDTITAHARLAGGQHHTLTLPAPRPAWGRRQTPPQIINAIDELLGTNTSAQIAVILNQRGLASGEGKPFHGLIVDHIIRARQLRPRRDRLRDTGLLTLTEMAAALSVSKSTVKAWGVSQFCR